jgi:hypothetical protein
LFLQIFAVKRLVVPVEKEEYYEAVEIYKGQEFAVADKLFERLSGRAKEA